MLRFREASVVPPGGVFFFVVKETNTRFESRYFPDLETEVRVHMKANGIPVPDNLSAVIEDYICHNVAENFCKGATDRKRVSPLSASGIRGFTESLFGVWKKWFKGESPYVSGEEASRRAGICLTCPMNDKSACTTCTGLKPFARKLIGAGRKTPYDDALGVCNLCGCMLEVKVHVQADILRRTVKPDSKEYPDRCWLPKANAETSG